MDPAVYLMPISSCVRSEHGRDKRHVDPAAMAPRPRAPLQIIEEPDWATRFCHREELPPLGR